jgi:hypothetical protein
MKDSIFKKLVRSLRPISPAIDIAMAPFTLMGSVWFRIARFLGLKEMRLTRSIFLKTGVYPIVDHYYEPLFDYRRLPDVPQPSHLDFNDEVQLKFIEGMTFGKELKQFPMNGSNVKYHYDNGSFPSGDAELYYSIIRKNKPRKILEVGSGFSTLIALEAIKQNRLEDGWSPELTCIEPYEMPQLEALPIKLKREKVEEVDVSEFLALADNDILFIDSSHIIRPGGDVNYLILKILPMLKPGVWVHFHDIFLPREYPVDWLRYDFRMWNEQFLLEAFLLGNPSYEIICALNYLKHTCQDKMADAFPVMATDQKREPGSFWIRKKS